MTANAPLAIETHGLAKEFGTTVALRDLTIAVPRGEVFGFLGPNGAGKTTSIKLLLGLTRPSRGSASLLGAPLGDRETRRKIGYLPELFRYQEWLSARDVLAFHARLIGIPKNERPAEIARALDEVGLAERARDRVGGFSKGMQQRLGLATALLGAPDLVFLDEPTSALDPVGRHDVRAIVERLAARGATVFLNSHLLTEVERVCARIAVVDRGAVVAQGSIDEMLGGTFTVRLRLENVGDEALAVLARYGRVEVDASWYVLSSTSDADVPGLVEALVHARVRVHAVETTRATLEERFLQLLRPEEPVARDRVA